MVFPSGPSVWICSGIVAVYLLVLIRWHFVLTRREMKALQPGWRGTHFSLKAMFSDKQTMRVANGMMVRALLIFLGAIVLFVVLNWFSSLFVSD